MQGTPFEPVFYIICEGEIMRKRPIEIKFRVSEQELEMLQKQIKDNVMNRNEYLVRLISNVPILPKEEFKQINQEFVTQNQQLRGIATNINQLAKIANTKKDIYAMTELDFAIIQVSVMREELQKTWDKVRGLLYGDT